jgi:hypothetical protein
MVEVASRCGISFARTFFQIETNPATDIKKITG